MSGRAPLSSLLDFAWRTAFRLGFPLARAWWRLTRPRHAGVAVAVYVGDALLLVRPSYRAGWHFPGGGVRRGETPEVAARRELRRRSASPRRRCFLRAAPAPVGMDGGTGYISLSYAWSKCQNYSATTER